MPEFLLVLSEIAPVFPASQNAPVVNPTQELLEPHLQALLALSHVSGEEHEGNVAVHLHILFVESQ